VGVRHHVSASDLGCKVHHIIAFIVFQKGWGWHRADLLMVGNKNNNVRVIAIYACPGEGEGEGEGGGCK
jgi:hypothetical protein